MFHFLSQGRCKQRGWGGFSPPSFGQTVNPIATRGADYTHHSTMSSPDFQTLQRACFRSQLLKFLFDLLKLDFFLEGILNCVKIEVKIIMKT